MKNLIKSLFNLEDKQELDRLKQENKKIFEQNIELRNELQVFNLSKEEIIAEISVHKNNFKEFGIDEITNQCIEECKNIIFEKLKDSIEISKEVSFNVTTFKGKITIIN